MKKSSYKHILKVTSITGGSQIAVILIRLLSSKFLAVILGPTGTGFIGLIQSTLQVITSFFCFGLTFSAVRNIAEASSKDEGRVALVIKSARFWLVVTGMLGTIFTYFSASWLSEITFGTDAYTGTFRWLSILVLLAQVTNGQLAILQGLRKIKEMAKAKVIGAFLGLFVTIPLYYFYGLDVVVLVLILLALLNLWRSWFYAHKIKLVPVSLTRKKILSEGHSLFSLGIVGMLNGLGIVLSAYLVRTIIQNNSDLMHVGVFQAAWAISVGYLQLIFNAMASDYFPRLTQSLEKPDQINRIMAEQGNIALWLGVPLLVFLAAGSDYVIHILYTAEYGEAAGVVTLMMIGIYFKLITWPMAFLLPAYNKKSLFIMTEFLWQSVFLLIVFLGWQYYGLPIIGYAFSMTYGLYFLLILLIKKNVFPSIKLEKDYIFEAIFGAFLVGVTVLIKVVYTGVFENSILLGFALLSMIYSGLKLKKIFLKEESK